MNTKNRSALAVGVLTSFLVLLANCSNATSSATSASTGNTGNTFVNCVSQPSDPNLTASTSSSISHQAGAECLTSCHNVSNGYANKRWTVAGTMYQSTLGPPVVVSIAPKTSGSVTINGILLTVDTCGNFYSQLQTLSGAASTTTAGVLAPNMTAQITTGANPANYVNNNCNAGGACHSGAKNDGTAGTRIY